MILDVLSFDVGPSEADQKIHPPKLTSCNAHCLNHLRIEDIMQTLEEAKQFSHLVNQRMRTRSWPLSFDWEMLKSVEICFLMHVFQYVKMLQFEERRGRRLRLRWLESPMTWCRWRRPWQEFKASRLEKTTCFEAATECYDVLLQTGAKMRNFTSRQLLRAVESQAPMERDFYQDASFYMHLCQIIA